MRLFPVLLLTAVGCHAPLGTEPDYGGDPFRNVSTLGWMSGSWIQDTDGGRYEEHWSSPRGGTMLGMSRMVQGGVTLYTESLRIEERDDGLHFVAVPSNLPLVDFVLVEHAGWEVQFQNPAGESPYSIGYRLQPDGVLLSWVELGGEDGRWKEFSRKRRGGLR